MYLNPRLEVHMNGDLQLLNLQGVVEPAVSSAGMDGSLLVGLFAVLLLLALAVLLAVLTGSELAELSFDFGLDCLPDLIHLSRRKIDAGN